MDVSTQQQVQPMKIHLLLVSLVLAPAVLCTSAKAAVVPADLLLGVGDFENPSAITHWDSAYTPITYDYMRVWPNKVLPTPNDTVAVGWRRASSSSIDPLGKKLVYRLSPTGIGGGNAQYFGLTNADAHDWAVLLSTLPVGPSVNGVPIRDGDTVTFRVDHIRMEGYSGVPVGYRLRVRTDTGAPSWLTLTNSDLPFAAELSHVIAPGSTTLTVEVFLIATGPLAGSQPGIYVDGARLSVRRAGSVDLETLVAPAPRNRSIRTLSAYWKHSQQPEYEAAMMYDVIMVGDDSAADKVGRLKAFNPNLKVYLYRTSNVSKTGDGSRDEYYSNAPIGYRYATTRHPEWLYPVPGSQGTYINNPDYPDTYYARRGDASYQSAWVERVLERAVPPGFDGIFMDDAVAQSRLPEGDGMPLIRPVVLDWEIQEFAHSVVPRLQSAGLDVMQNAAGYHLTGSGPGPVLFDPFWQPISPRDTPDYAANSPANVASMFQEWAFFRMTGFLGAGDETDYTRNVYDSVYWKQCLDDMDAVALWNLSPSIPVERRKYLHMFTVGVDNTVAVPQTGVLPDPAYGLDGWLQFGLCSYLLGQNEWTTFGCGLRTTFTADIDYSITLKLGQPDGAHEAYMGDQYFRYRMYKATADGGVGGVVVVNGRTDVSKSYTLPFDVVDQPGKTWPAGSVITLKPNTGRILLRGQSRITLTISAGPTNVASGQSLPVVVNYVNQGSAPAENAVVRVALPANTAYVAGSAESSGGVYDAASKTVTWSVGALAAGAGGVKAFQATVL